MLVNRYFSSSNPINANRFYEHDHTQSVLESNSHSVSGELSHLYLDLIFIHHVSHLSFRMEISFLTTARSSSSLTIIRNSSKPLSRSTTGSIYSASDWLIFPMSFLVFSINHKTTLMLQAPTLLFYTVQMKEYSLPMFLTY